MTTLEHLEKLESMSGDLAEGRFSEEPATQAQIVELATVVTELATIVRRMYAAGQ